MSRRKEEIKKYELIKRYMFQIQQQLYSMFSYSGIPFRKEFIEWELQRIGFVACGKQGEKILVGSISGYDFDEYGLPLEGSRADFMTRYGYQFSGIIGEDIVIGYNNSIRTPEVGIGYYAEQFTQIDTAIAVNVKHSMVSSVPVARNENVRKAISSIMSDIEVGKYNTIADDTILDTLVKNGEAVREPFQILHLTQPEQIERVQYLSKLYDDLLRRLWTTYGHSMNSTGKMAQVNEMELEGYETYSSIIPLDMLEARQDFIDRCNKTFGTSWTVTFGKAWEHILTEQKKGGRG